MDFACDPDSFYANWGTDVSVWIRLVSGETLLQATNFTSHRWDLNPVLAGNMAIAASMLKLLHHLDHLIEKFIDILVVSLPALLKCDNFPITYRCV